MLDSVSIAARHPIMFEGAAPNFFEGALMGNGALGLVVTTRPDAICLHLGHNNVWDIRKRELDMEKITTFRQVYDRVSEIPTDLESLFDDPWYREYHDLMESGYTSVKYPKPFPCGTVLLFYDMCKAEVLGHCLDISTGILSMDFLAGKYIYKVKVVIDPYEDKVSIKTFDSDGIPSKSIFNRICIIPEEEKETQLPQFEADSVENGFKFRQRLPCNEFKNKGDIKTHPEDKAFLVEVFCSQKFKSSGNKLDAALSEDEPFELKIQLKEGMADEIFSDELTGNDCAINFETAYLRSVSAWKEYWNKSGISLEDEFLERVWYWNQYFFNCGTKPEAFCPGLFANWIYKSTGTAWHGDYHLNYNTQQVFWGSFSSNHPEKHLAYLKMVEHILPVSRKWAKEYFSMRGAYFPHSAYPVKMNVMPYPTPMWGWQICEVPWTVQSLWWHFEYTKDIVLLKERIFTPIKEAVMFLADYLKRNEAHGPEWMDDRYHVFPSVVPELYGLAPGFRKNADCIVDITLIKFVFKAFIEACGVLNIKTQENELLTDVKDILNNLPDYPVASTAEGNVFINVIGERPEEVQNTPNTIMPVFPGEDIGMDSLPDDYETAARTWRMHKNEGGTNLVFYNLQGARLGILDLEKFKRHVKYCMHPNGTCGNRVQMSGGRYEDDRDFDFMMIMGIWFENMSLPGVINECLMHGYGSVIRLFPNWPLARKAAFRDLRAVGAFLVSADCSDGLVNRVEIYSEKGGIFRMYNPWSGTVICNGKLLDGKILEVGTDSGDRLVFQCA